MEHIEDYIPTRGDYFGLASHSEANSAVSFLSNINHEIGKLAV